jgi:hypothetical protein
MTRRREGADPYGKQRDAGLKAITEKENERRAAHIASNQIKYDWQEDNAVKIACMLEALGQTATIQTLPHVPDRKKMTFDMADINTLAENYAKALENRGVSCEVNEKDALSLFTTLCNKLGLTVPAASPGREMKNLRSNHKSLITGKYIIEALRFGIELPEQLRNQPAIAEKHLK